MNRLLKLRFHISSLFIYLFILIIKFPFNRSPVLHKKNVQRFLYY